MPFRRGKARRVRVLHAHGTTARLAAIGFAMMSIGGCTTIVAPDADTAADIERTILENLDGAWRDVDRGTERPATGASRWVLPTGWGYVVARCMIEAGYDDYDFSVSSGFISGETQPDLSGRQGLAWYTCSRAYPIYSTAYARLDDDRARELYSYYVRSLIPCLQSSGVRVTGIPTEVEFLDGGEGDAGSWNPYLDIVPPWSAEIAVALFEKCPAYPR